MQNEKSRKSSHGVIMDEKGVLSHVGVHLFQDLFLRTYNRGVTKQNIDTINTKIKLKSELLLSSSSRSSPCSFTGKFVSL